jgi:hypothetical protein
MGNRAVITTAPFNKNNVGIYVHWNGGQESVAAFAEAARKLGYRDPTSDNSYGMARLCQLIGLFFGADESTSLGIGKCSDLDCDNGDNGVWLIGPNWTMVGHLDKRTLKPAERHPCEPNMDIVERIMVATKAASDAVKAGA